MPSLRKPLRLLLLLFVNVFDFALLLLAQALLLPLKDLRRRVRNFMFRHWAKVSLRILGGRLAVEGTPPVAPFFLVSNHLSYVDVLVLGSCVEAFFIGKLEIRSWPLFGWLCRAAGTIFIDRELRRDVVRVNSLVEDVLNRGFGIVLFAEGTSTQGDEVAPFRSSLLDFPVRQERAVHAAAISYRTPAGEIPAHLGVCWWGDAPFFPHGWQLLGLSSFEATLRFSEHTAVSNDRKELGRKLHSLVVAEFQPVVSYEGRADDPGF